MQFIYCSIFSLIISKQLWIVFLVSDLPCLHDLSQSTVLGGTESLSVPKDNLKRRYVQEKSVIEGAEQNDPYCHHKASFWQAYIYQDRCVRNVS